MAKGYAIRVDQFAASMSEEEFAEAVQLMDGTVTEEGDDFEILNCIAPDAARARKGFVDEMQRRLGEVNDFDLIWRYKPAVGTRREGDVILHVAGARFKIVPRAPAPENTDG